MLADMLADTLALIGPADEAAMASARTLHSRLTKPPGSLGALEDLAVRLAGLAGTIGFPTVSMRASELEAVIGRDGAFCSHQICAKRCGNHWPRTVVSSFFSERCFSKSCCADFSGKRSR